MEVLQTSALPLGDGAGWTQLNVQEGPAASRRRGDNSARGRSAGSSVVVRIRGQCCGGQTVVCQLARQPSLARQSWERRLERETGFEPATSTLARSHSTTELFPLSTETQA